MPPPHSTNTIDVLSVASAILDRCGAMGAMKLQKLVYYAQAWHLAVLNAPLFEEEEEAWAYGPVVYKLYEQHRGRLVIERIVFRTDTAARQPDPRSATCIAGVVSHYGSMSGHALSEMTHREDPWRHARELGAASASGRQIISKESMKKYYAAVRLPFHEFFA